MWTVKDLIETLEKFPADLPVSIMVSIPNDDYISGYEDIECNIEDVLISLYNDEVIIQA